MCIFSHSLCVFYVADESNAHNLMLNILHMVKVTCSSGLEGKKDCTRENFRKIQRYITESGLEQTPIGKR